MVVHAADGAEPHHDLEPSGTMVRGSDGALSLSRVDDIPLLFLDEMSNVYCVDVGNAHLARQADAAWTALMLVNDEQFPEVFLRGGSVARITEDEADDHIAVEPYSQPSLRDHLSRAISCIKFVKGQPVLVKPPTELVQTLLHRRPTDLPKAPRINRITSVPVFGADESLLTTPGYHPGARSYYAPQADLDVQALPDWGGYEAETYHADQYGKADDVDNALTLLYDELFGDFPFADQASRANALALTLEPFVRELVGNNPTPMYTVRAHAHGTGKSLLAQVALSVGCGNIPASPPPSNDDNEFRKRLTADLIQAPPAIWFDNCTRLDSPALAAALTATRWTDRILGHSKMADAQIRNTWCATMNNASISKEIARRCVLIDLDARVEKPFERTGPTPGSSWRHQLPTWSFEHRSDLVWAALVLVQNWLHGTHTNVSHEGELYRPRAVGSEFLGSYASWSEVMGGILAAAGVGGFLGNLDRIHDDIDTVDENAVLLAQWHERTKEPQTISEVASMLNGQRVSSPLPAAWDLPVELQGRSEEMAKRLQIWLRTNKGSIQGGYRLVNAGTRPKRWYVEHVG